MLILKNEPRNVSIISRSHAPAWECSPDAPASRAASPQKRDAFATQIGSHAGAWEPEKIG